MLLAYIVICERLRFHCKKKRPEGGEYVVEKRAFSHYVQLMAPQVVEAEDVGRGRLPLQVSAGF